MKVFCFNHKTEKRVSVSLVAISEVEARTIIDPLLVTTSDWSCEMMLPVPGCGNPFCNDPQCQNPEHNK